uniref:Uncharacterized protein n=1 Tax=uncultured bacterium BLR18 TaxID=506518 RepID=C0INM4_9BACT|nr:hypothetical protein AKSOIL_0295 [uncultured bacterium BLR18]
MRSGVWIGVAMAMLTVHLMTGNGDVADAEPSGARAASAAAALLAGAATSAPQVAEAPAPQPAFAAMGAAADGPVPAPMPAVARAAASQAMRAASVESDVAALRSRGEGEDAVYRVRAGRLPAAEVARLTAMETAEAAWRRQLASTPPGCATSCDLAAPEHVVASAYRRDVTPKLTLE